MYPASLSSNQARFQLTTLVFLQELGLVKRYQIGVAMSSKGIRMQQVIDRLLKEDSRQLGKLQF